MSRAAVARARADIKDMYVDTGGRDMVPFLEVLDTLVEAVLRCGSFMRRFLVLPGVMISTVVRFSGRRWSGCFAHEFISSALLLMV